MKKHLFLLFFVLVAVEASAQGVVRSSAPFSGRIFDDRNSNGVFDAGDRAMFGVAASDGRSVVRTDRDGRFVLSGHDGAKFIFITTPSGYTVTGKHYLFVGRQSYDFALRRFNDRVKSDGSHSFIHITDTEISSADGHEEFVDDLRHYADDQRSAFIIHTGDICYEKGLNAHIKMVNDSNMGLPVRYAIGNHDYVKGEFGEQLFESLYGPIYYSFDVGNTHYVVTPMAYGDHKPGFAPELLYEWLRNDLQAMRSGMSVVVFNHDLQCRDGRFVFGDVDLLKYNLKAWIYGHWHINHLKHFDHVTTISTSADKGGIDHSAATFRRVDVARDGAVSSRLIYPYVDRSLVIADFTGNTLSVNAYNSSSPVVGVTAKFTILGKRSSAKLGRVTDWNWRVELPTGACDLSVEAAYHDGQRSVAKWEAASDSLLSSVWSANVGSNIYMSSPVVVDGRVFVGVVDESGSGRAGVAAVNAKSGAKVWFFNTRNSVKNAIAVAAGRVFAQDAEGFLYAVDAASGVLVWEHKLSVADPLPAVVEGLAVHDGRLYAGTGKGLTAFDLDGHVVWVNEHWAQNEGTISNFAFTDGMILTSSQWQALFANDLVTGRVVWRADRDGIRFRASTPVVAHGVIYLLSQNSLFLLNPRSGEVILRRELPFNVEVGSKPLFVGGVIIFGTTDAGIQALDAVTLCPRWSVATGAGLIYTAPYYRYPVSNIESSAIVTHCGRVLIGAADGVVRVIDVESGRVVSQRSVGAPILTTFSGGDGGYFVADYGGSLYRFCLR